MNRDQKTAVIEEIAGQLRAADAIFAVDYRGISVSQVAELRSRLTEADARLRIVKNSLSERAADQAGMDTLKPMLVGPTALAFVSGDAALAAKALNDTGRRLNVLDFKGGIMNGSAVSADDVRSIARLPARDVLNSQLVGTIAAPLTGLARGLNALIAGIAIQLQAIVDQGLVSGSAPEAAAAESEAAAAEPEAAAAEPEAAAAEPEAAAAEPDAPGADSEAAEADPEGAEAQTTETETQAASDAAPSDE